MSAVTKALSSFVTRKNPGVDLQTLLSRKRENPVAGPMMGFATGMVPRVLTSSVSVLGGAAAAVAWEKLALDQLSPKWHMLGHAGTAVVSALLPSSRFSAAFGGAAFYPLVSETYKALTSKVDNT